MLIDLLHRFVQQQYSRAGISSRFLHTAESTIHYYENSADASRTLVLLHGLGTSSSTWVKILPHLAKTFRVIALDLPGFGFSTLKNGKDHLRFCEVSDVLARIIPEITKTSFAILGHSLGGWLAADFAIRSPGLVHKLVLINPAGINYPGIEEQRRLFEITTLRSLYALLDRLWLKYPWYFKPFGPAIRYDLKKRKVAEFVRSIQEKDFLNGRLSSLKKPAHLVWGRNDGVISPETVQIMQEKMPGLTTNFIERCGHVPQLERPGELRRILDEVL
ncbi:MAG: alpha/beta hydrolase [Ignavibacteriales bacterium]|nr:alpha/beta hydrolase [Ignavibacteriales bacterium]